MEAWREELYHAGIFDVIKSKYKTVLNNAKSKVTNKSSSKQSNPNREWKNHKYVNKIVRGNSVDYIYPEDLKKSHENKSNVRALANNYKKEVVPERYWFKKQIKESKELGKKHTRIPNEELKNRHYSEAGHIYIPNEDLKSGHYREDKKISNEELKNKSGGGVSVKNNARLSKTKLSEPIKRFEDEDKSILEKTDDFLYSTNMEYKILSDGIKAAGTVLSRLYNKGKSFFKNNPDFFKISSKREPDYSRQTGAVSILELEGAQADSSGNSNEIPQEIAEALYDAMSAYYDEKKKNGG